MFLNLSHKSLHVYTAVRELTKEVYAITNLLPAEEKFNMVPQLRRAVLSVKLNLAEGASRKSGAERNRFVEVARGSVVEIDAAIETAVDLDYYKPEQLRTVGELPEQELCHAVELDRTIDGLQFNVCRLTFHVLIPN